MQQAKLFIILVWPESYINDTKNINFINNKVTLCRGAGVGSEGSRLEV